MQGMLQDKKILMLHSTSDLYGASRIFLQTAAILKEQGAKVTAFISESGPLSEQLQKSGVDVQFLRLGILRRKYFNPWGILNRIFYLFKATRFLKRFIEENKVDLIYSNTSGVFSGIIAARLTNTPHIWHIHEIIASPKVFAGATARLMRAWSDKNIFVSDATLDHWTSIDPGIAHLNKAVRIYNGLDITDFFETLNSSKTKSLVELGINIPDDVIVIGMIGRINPWKGQLYFIDIAKELIARNKSVHFIMAGDPFPGYEWISDKIRKKIKEEGLTNHITDLGYQQANQNFFKAIDILIVPSTLPDPLPTVVLEAMSFAKPVVGTALGGITEMISEGVTGFLIHPNDAKDSADIIQKLIEDRSLRQRMGATGLELLRTRFSPERYKSLILESVTQALNERK